jgi:GH24 family phage-related lysozyme (muramidase)
MNQEAAKNIAVEYIKKWERLGWKTPTGGSYSPEQAKNVPLDQIFYPFPDGSKYSIGWGTWNTLRTTGEKITRDTTITKQEADDNLYAEIDNQIIPYLDKKIKVELTENQYAALISIMYNGGPGVIDNGIADAINSGSSNVGSIWKKTALTEVGKPGVILPGLVNRRKDEVMLWEGNYNELYSYYLRNSTTINYAIVGGILIGLTGYIYYLKKKNIF